MTYDSWKLRSLDDEYGWYDEDETCEHEDPQIDIVTGEWECYKCGKHRPATIVEMDIELRHQAEYAERVAREHHREFWRRLILPIRWPIYRLLQKVWPRKSCKVLTDDEIPF